MYDMGRVDPRAKIMIVLAMTTASMVINNIWYQAGMLIAMIVMMALGGISIRKQFRQAKTAAGIVVFLFILQGLFGRWILGGMLCLRLMIIIMSALILLTGKTRDYLLGMTQMKIPYEIVYMVMSGIHFFPILKEEALDYYYSIQLRGTEIKKASIPAKIRIYMSISFPILANALRRAKDMAVSMETRRYRMLPKRTYLRKLSLKKSDKAIIIIFPIICAVLIFAGCNNMHLLYANTAKTPAKAPSQIVLSWCGDPESTQAISWKGGGDTTYVEYASAARYNAEGVYSSCVKGRETSILGGRYHRYSADISGLKKDTKYYYRIGSGRKWSKKAEFTTAGSGNFSFMSLGDVQYQIRGRDYKIWGNFISDAYKHNKNVRFSLMMGDMVDGNADIRDWNAFFGNASIFTSIPMMTTPGNHETSVIPLIYKQMMKLPGNGPDGMKEELYSFDYGDCHFVSINSNLLADERKNEIGNKRWSSLVKRADRWISSDLAGSDAKYKIVYMHHPAYPVSDDGNSIYKRIRKNWVPIFEKQGVDLVLCGHQHVYMRTRPIKGITYIMADSGQKVSRYYRQGDKLPGYVEKISTSNCTYEKYDVTATGIKISVYNDEGTMVDKLNVH